jgi:hypothetical protein
MSNPMPTRRSALAFASGALLSLPILLWAATGVTQEQPGWGRSAEPTYQPRNDAYRPSAQQFGSAGPGANDAYVPPPRGAGDAYVPQQGYAQYGGNSPYTPPPGYGQPYPPPQPGYGQPYAPGYGQPYGPPPSGYGQPYSPGYGQPYEPPRDNGYGYAPRPYDNDYARRRYYDDAGDGSYSSREILDAGHQFFGSVSQGLAKVIEYAFQSQGRPNGYILGEEVGGAFVAGLRYGEGFLHTKDAGRHRVYWQGPSIGYDAGAEGSKVMMLVYRLHDPAEIYRRFAGVDGSAYFVGGVGLTFQKNGDVVVAPIRAGVGFRLGANVGYLKYTRRPTWNPF